MSDSINQVVLQGNLADDPKLSSWGPGARVAELRIATSNPWRNPETFETENRTEWHDVLIMSEDLVQAAEGLRRGSKVQLRGQLCTRKWRGRGGEHQYSTKVILDGPGASLAIIGAEATSSKSAKISGGKGGKGAHHCQDFADEIGDDNIPF